MMDEEIEEQYNMWAEEEEMLDRIAIDLARMEDPVTIWPLCGWQQGWCTSFEGCQFSYNPRLGCHYFTTKHPEYDVDFKEVHKDEQSNQCDYSK